MNNPTCWRCHSPIGPGQVVVVACILPACATAGLAALGAPIDAQFNSIVATMEASGTPQAVAP